MHVQFSYNANACLEKKEEKGLNSQILLLKSHELSFVSEETVKAHVYNRITKRKKDKVSKNPTTYPGLPDSKALSTQWIFKDLGLIFLGLWMVSSTGSFFHTTHSHSSAGMREACVNVTAPLWIRTHPKAKQRCCWITRGFTIFTPLLSGSQRMTWE